MIKVSVLVMIQDTSKNKMYNFWLDISQWTCSSILDCRWRNRTLTLAATEHSPRRRSRPCFCWVCAVCVFLSMCRRITCRQTFERHVSAVAQHFCATWYCFPPVVATLCFDSCSFLFSFFFPLVAICWTEEWAKTMTSKSTAMYVPEFPLAVS